MRPRSVVVALVITIAVMALLWSRQTYEPLSYYSSASYVERVNAMIRKSALAYDCRSDRIGITQRASEAERKWFEASHLESDVELFNRNRELFGHFFVVQDCQLREINPYLRTIRLPFATTVQWLGNIEYSGPGADATLRSSNGRNILVNRTLPNLPLREVRTRVGATQDVAANGVHLDFAGGALTPAVEVHGVAGNVVLEQRTKRGQPGAVRLLGNAVPEGRVALMRTGDWLHLESSSPAASSETFLFTGERMFERLSTVRTRNARQERTFEEEEPLLRWVGGEDGEEMLTFADALSRSVTNAIQQVGGTRAKELANAFDVQLTIDRLLQASLDATLSEQTRRLVDNIAAGEPFASSVTVMNGKSGEVLAAVSFPSSEDLSAMRPVTEEERRRLLVNHNFKRHAIGSAGKPLLYAAIGTRHPFLLDLTVAPHAPEVLPNGDEQGEREDLQFFLGLDYKLWPHADAPMDLESALERSCNKFTVELATLALATPRDRNERRLTEPLERVFAPQPDVVWPKPGERSGIAIGGQELTFAPSLGMYMKDDWRPVPPREETSAVLRPGSLDRINEAPFIDAFGEITGVRIYGGLAAPHVDEQTPGRTALQTMQYDLRAWRPLIERLVAGEDAATSWKVRAAFQSVSPERVNLNVNQVTDLRTEFVSLLLGGSSSQWTNVQLAEAMSRLMTGRQVEATLVRGVHARGAARPPVPPPPSFPALQVGDDARAAVLRGMRRTVLGTHGTATALAPLVRGLERRYPGYAVALFSKTGSPTVVRPEVKPVGATVRELIVRGHLFFRGDSLFVSDGRRIVPYAAPRTNGRAAFLATLGRAARTSAARVGVEAGPRTVSRIAGYADRFSRYKDRLIFTAPISVRLSPELPMPFHVIGGTLVVNRDHPIFDPALQTDSSAVYMFTLAKWRGDPAAVPTAEELARDDSRVVTVTMYFDVGPGSAVAVEAAREMLPKIARLLD
jgi:cell division protein FtsI/penicillin-binding protein 2